MNKTIQATILGIALLVISYVATTQIEGYAPTDTFFILVALASAIGGFVMLAVVAIIYFSNGIN
jgi:hypothetical protein